MWKSAAELLRKLRSAREEDHPVLPKTRRSLSSGRVQELQQLERALEYRFMDRTLLDRALTHRSCLAEPGFGGDDYESMEFLGDAILGFVIAEFLYLTYPEMREGELTKLRAQLVSGKPLSELAGELELGRYLNLGRGEERAGGRSRQAILGDLFESVIAALYLDGGLETARSFILTAFEDRLAAIARGDFEIRDYKSLLQERLHQCGRVPHYEVIQEEGPDHSKEFTVRVSTEGVVLGQGRGASKKSAEKKAARRGVERLESDDVEFPVDQDRDDVVKGVSDHRSRQAFPPEK